MLNGKDFFEGLRQDNDDMLRQWPPLWIVSLSDMMMLLLTFFIFFYSVTTLKKLPQVLEQLRRDFGVIVPIKQHELPVPDRSTLRDRAYVKRESDVIEKFRKYIEKSGLARDVEIRAGAGELRIVIATPILYDLGKAELKAEAVPVLANLAALFRDNDSQVRVEGHTDNLPIRTDKFPSNWELSASRAISVIKYFVSNEGITPTRFEALGYGEFKPAASNENEAGRAKNRRVEIKIIPQENSGK